MSPTNSPGLRDRKKQKTRWSIQEHALRLFQEQGYDQTTVDQIAAAAEISPSTFFRYFKTKEDVILQDEYDPLMERLFAAAPPDLPLIPALRHALRQALAGFDEAERRKMEQRVDLMMAVPALRMRLVDNMIGSIDVIASGAAARTGRPADDFGLRAFAGACIGALLAAFFAWLDSDRTDDLIALMDRALAELEAAFA
jgi:AcrR family transcriptional regulator